MCICIHACYIHTCIVYSVYVCMYVCMYVCIYIYIYICFLYLYLYLYLYLCIHMQVLFVSLCIVCSDCKACSAIEDQRREAGAKGTRAKGT